MFLSNVIDPRLTELLSRIPLDSSAVTSSFEMLLLFMLTKITVMIFCVKWFLIEGILRGVLTWITLQRFPIIRLACFNAWVVQNEGNRGKRKINQQPEDAHCQAVQEESPLCSSSQVNKFILLKAGDAPLSTGCQVAKENQHQAQTPQQKKQLP